MFKPIAPALAAFTLITACASTPSDEPKGAAKFAEDPSLGEKVDKICFNRSIDGFTRSDRDTIVVTARANDQYLLEIKGPCNNLRFAQSIAIDSALSCVSRLDTILISTSAFSLNDNLGGPQRCFIKEIYAWDENATDEVEDEEDSEDGSETEVSVAP